MMKEELSAEEVSSLLDASIVSRVTLPARTVALRARLPRLRTTSRSNERELRIAQ